MGVQSFYLNKLMLCRLQRLYAGLYFNRLGAPIVHCLLIRGLFTTPCPLFRLRAPIMQCTLTSLLRGYLLHMRYHVLRCGSREYPTFHYSLAHPLFLVARVCRCAAARYGCACTVAVLDNRSGTALSLGCGVDASGRRFGFARSGGRLGRLLGVLCTAGYAAIGGGCRGCGLWRFTPGCPTAGWAPRPRL